MRRVRTYRAGQNRFFDDLFNMLVSYIAFGSAARACQGGDAAFSGGDKVQVPGSVLGFGFRVCPRPILCSIVEDRRPDSIDLEECPWAIDWESVGTISPRVEPKLVLTPVIHAAFVHYYESAIDQMRTAHGYDTKVWPNVMRFGWAVRNAFAHDGRVLFTNQNAVPVTWRGLTFGPQDNGRQILYKDLMPADIIVLMDEMDATF